MGSEILSLLCSGEGTSVVNPGFEKEDIKGYYTLRRKYMVHFHINNHIYKIGKFI